MGGEIRGALKLCTGRGQLVGIIMSRICRGRRGGAVVVKVLDGMLNSRGDRDDRRVLRVHITARVLLERLVEGASTCRLARTRVTLVVATSSLRSVKGIDVPRRVLGGPNELASRRFGVVGDRDRVKTSVVQGVSFPRSGPLMHAT